MTRGTWRICAICGAEFIDTLPGATLLLVLRDGDSVPLCSRNCLRACANGDQALAHRQIQHRKVKQAVYRFLVACARAFSSLP